MINNIKSPFIITNQLLNRKKLL